MATMAVTANKLHIRSAEAAPHSRAPLAGAFSVFMAMAFASTSHALDWHVEPSVGAAAIYTDNVRQSANNPKDALILSVTPGFTLNSKGSRRVQATMQYDLRGVARFGDNQSDNLYHNLNATGKAELIEDFLFIDGTARISQELISLLGSPADASINDSNRATVGTYSISPYIQKRLGTFADAQMRYTASGAIFENDVASDASVNALTAGLTSGTRFSDLSWGLNYSIREAANRDDIDTTFERASIEMGYALTRKFRVIGSVGQDWNDYPSLTETSGSSYSVGFGWAPTRRTSVEASAGERYFGSTYNLSARHRTRMSNWNVSYVEDVSDVPQFLSRSGLVSYIQCPGSPQIIEWPYSAPYPSDCVLLGQLPGLVFDLRSGVFISKTLRAGVSLNVSKVSYSLNYSDSKRLYASVNAEDHAQSLGATVAYRMTPQTTFHGGITFTRTQVPPPLVVTARDDNLTTLSLGLSHQFAEKLDGALTFHHTQRDSNVATSDYDENRLTASVNMRF